MTAVVQTRWNRNAAETYSNSRWKAKEVTWISAFAPRLKGKTLGSLVSTVCVACWHYPKTACSIELARLLIYLSGANMGEAIEIRRGFITNQLPQLGKKVEVLCEHGDRTFILALLCAWSEDGWVLSGTKRRVDYEVIGWRNVQSRTIEGR